MAKYLSTAMMSGCIASAIFISSAAAQTNSEKDDASTIPREGQSPPREARIDSESDREAEILQEIIVTGTFIRGMAPVGANAISMDRNTMEITGVTNPAHLLATRPELGLLNVVPVSRAEAGVGAVTNRPDIRGLQAFAGGTSTTLLLMDGHRLPGMGITTNGPDADMLPLGALERVEIVTDGGSAIYGSDAVGGVVNYITRRSYDGVGVSVKTGFADDYEEYNLNLTAGHEWGWGTGVLAYSYTKHDALHGRDRGYVKSPDWLLSEQLGYEVGSNRDCSPGTVTMNGVNYALPGLTTDAHNLGNRCDDGNFSFYPTEEKHALYARLTLDNGGPVSFSVPLYYMNRKNNTDFGPLSQVQGFTIPAGSASAIPGLPGPQSDQTIYSNFGSALGRSAPSSIEMETYGFAPTLDVDLPHEWRMNLLAQYGKGETEFNRHLLNPQPINDAIAAGTFDFLNLASPASADALARAADWHNYAEGINEIKNARVVFDGPLFSLPGPGGAVQLAVGAEYIEEEYELRADASVTRAGIRNIPAVRADRDVAAAFAEISLPIIEPGSDSIFHSLTVSIAGRHDDYSDFGETTNMRYAIEFEPVDWLRLRLNKGESFLAPGLSDIALGDAPEGRGLIPLAFAPQLFFLYGQPGLELQPDSLNMVYAVLGTMLPLQPQTADILSYGFDIKVPFVQGLDLGATYYEIDFEGQIGNPPFGANPNFFAQFPNNYSDYSKADFAAFRDAMAAIISNPEDLLGFSLNDLYMIVDGRRTNLGESRVAGVDAYIRYSRDESWGSWFVSLNANRPTKRESSAFPGAPFVSVNVGDAQNRLKASASLGAEVGRLRGQVTFTHTGAFDITPTAGALFQDRVASYNLVNIGAQYDLAGFGERFKDMKVSLNIDNLFDRDPSLDRTRGRSYSNGTTLGRLVRLGVETKF